MKRRDFIKYSSAGLAALVVGPKIPGILDNPVFAAAPALTVNLTVTDCIKEMVTHNTGLLPNGTRVGTGNPARCYFWIYKATSPDLPADCPGPYIFTTSGSSVTVNVKNDLQAIHRFSIPRLGVTTGDIAPGATGSVTFTAGAAGTYLYYDDRNAPVNRVMGLHGAFIVMPAAPVAGHKFTPYDNPQSNTQQLFDDLGTAPWWPGLAWEEGDPATNTPPFRQYIWVMHQASPKLFSNVGTWQTFHPNQEYPAKLFTRWFLHSPFNPVHDPFNVNAGNYTPIYFTICGQSGHFAHNNPYICPINRVGEPALIRILNAGLWHHSTHIHANHIYVLQKNNRTDVFSTSFNNPIWVDVYNSNPLDTYDWLVPFMRPPDIPNLLGIGRQDVSPGLPCSGAQLLGGFGVAPGGPPFVPVDIPAAAAVTTYPPEQELMMAIPQAGSRMVKALDGVTDVDAGVMLAPLCFPMHDHSEPSQTGGGGNYNTGLISGISFTGDRFGAKPGQPGVRTYPMAPPEHGPAILPNTAGADAATVPFESPSIE